MQTNIKLALILLLLLFPIIQACTITPNPASGQPNTAIQFTVQKDAAENGAAKFRCKDGDQLATLPEGNGFSCTYTEARIYTATVETRNQDNEPVGVCTSQVTIEATQQPPAADPRCGTCSNRQKFICDSNGKVIQPVPTVECCSSSECGTTCSGNQVVASTCGTNNRCVASGSSGFQRGLCGYDPVCALVTSRSRVTEGDSLFVTVGYSKFLASPPDRVTVNCGDSATVVASGCTGSDGSCNVQCTYARAGSYNVGAVIQDVTCSGAGVTVASLNAPAPSPQCSISTSASRVEVGSVVEVTNRYSNLPREAGRVELACGDGSKVNINCTGTGGACTGICNYTLPGTYRPSAVLAGVACGGGEVTVVPKPVASQRLEPAIEIKTAASTPSPIIESAVTRVSLTTESSEAFQNVSCSKPEGSGACSCSLSSTTGLNPLVECTVNPPVKGEYQLQFQTRDGRSKLAKIQLTPGSEAIAVQNISSNPELTFWAAVALVALLVAYGAYYLWGRLEAKLTYKEKLLERRKQLQREMEVAKFRFMKGEINQKEFEEQYKAKQKEVTDINTRLEEVEKQEK